jgi:hypothetical protein
MLDMDYALESDGQQRLEEYFERIGKVLGHSHGTPTDRLRALPAIVVDGS